MDNYDFSPTKGWTTKEPSSQEPSLPPHFPGNRLKLPAQENVTMPLPHKLSPLPFPPPRPHAARLHSMHGFNPPLCKWGD